MDNTPQSHELFVVDSVIVPRRTDINSQVIAGRMPHHLDQPGLNSAEIQCRQ
jgi:hypothetical protein